MLSLPLANLPDIGMGRQRAKRAEIRGQDALVGLFHDGENLIHKQNRRFEKNIGVGVGAFLREIERIADGVRYVLDVAGRVVVSQNVGATLPFKPTDF